MMCYDEEIIVIMILISRGSGNRNEGRYVVRCEKGKLQSGPFKCGEEWEEEACLGSWLLVGA